MANEKTAGQELLLDVRIAEASSLYKFYLNYESAILGTSAVIIFLLVWESMGGALSRYNPIPFLRINPMFMFQCDKDLSVSFYLPSVFTIKKNH